jgi:hypothetical protein
MTVHQCKTKRATNEGKFSINTNCTGTADHNIVPEWDNINTLLLFDVLLLLLL